MTREEIEEIKAKMCDDYCIWRDIAFSSHKDVDEAEEFLAKYCDECPLNKLGGEMERIVSNIEAYANGLVERVIRIRDHYDMSREDRDTLADICNLVDHNRKELKEI